MDLQTIDQRIEWFSFFLLESHTDRPTLMGVFGPEAKDTQSSPFQDDPSKPTMITEGERQVDEREESLRSFVIGNGP